MHPIFVNLNCISFFFFQAATCNRLFVFLCYLALTLSTRALHVGAVTLLMRVALSFSCFGFGISPLEASGYTHPCYFDFYVPPGFLMESRPRAPRPEGSSIYRYIYIGLQQDALASRLLVAFLVLVPVRMTEHCIVCDRCQDVYHGIFRCRKF